MIKVNSSPSVCLLIVGLCFLMYSISLYSNFLTVSARSNISTFSKSVRKLEYKEMLYIRKHKPTINKQTEGELFTLIIRNVKLETSMERDVQKYLNKKAKNKNFNKK